MIINKDNIIKWIMPVFAVVMALLSVFLLNKWQEFAFFSREQSQIFLFDWQDILSKAGVLGGVAMVLSQFLVQFFRIPLVGALVTAVLGLCAALLLWRTVSYKGAREAVFPLCFIPVFFQEGALEDSIYYYQGFVAFVLAVLFLWAFIRIFSGKSVIARSVAGVVMAVFLYLIAGSTALLFATGVLLLEILSKKKDWYFSVLPVLAVLICGFIAVRSGSLQNLKQSLLQGFYYEPMLEPGWYIHASWIAFPIVILFSVLLSGIKSFFSKAACALCSVILSLFVFFSIPDHIDRKYYDMLRVNHYISVEDWDSILSDKTSSHYNYLMMSARNLALSKKGQLLERLFEYPQKGTMSLMISDELGDKVPDVAALCSVVGYQMGNVAHAQNKAFDASVGNRFGNPSLIMRLIRTNLVWGSYEVAEKYIKMLEKTWAYDEEASGYRRFLGDEEAIKADPTLGRLKRCLTSDDHFVGMEPHVDLALILKANPDDKAARDYLVSYMLLAKDIEGLRYYIENEPKAYDTEGNLNTYLQEVIMIYSEGNDDYCREHGVTDATFKRYEAFKKRFLELRATNGDPIRQMKSFSNTFWYYYMFIKN